MVYKIISSYRYTTKETVLVTAKYKHNSASRRYPGNDEASERKS